MKRYIQAYIFLIKAFFKVKRQQPLDFFIGMLGALLIYIPNLIFLYLLNRQNWALAGLSREQLILLQGIFIIVLSPMNIICDNLWGLKEYLIDGSFIKYYFKPGNSLFFYLSESINLRSIPEALVGVSLIVLNINFVTYTWVSLITFVISLFFACLVPFSLRLISAATGFWFTNSFGMMNMVSNLLNYGKYPTSMYGNVISRLLLSVFPIGLIAYFPYLILTRNDGLFLSLCLQILISLGIFSLAIFIWEKGIVSYGATGS